tara:strand:- start:337 stop:1257 length:921 start_codon:yes stop_codon:yes gene_type:complete
MALSTTSNFSGKAAGFYISAALKEAKSLEFLTKIENIKFKSNIQRMDNSGTVIQNADCNFQESGSLDLTEKILEPKNLMINIDLCKKELLDSWEALQMRAGAGAPPPPAFEDYVISYLGEIIANGVENDIWAGDNGAGRFLGFMTATTGLLLPAVDATVVQSSASGAFDVNNIIANLQTATSDLADNISTILRKDDLHIYMSPKTYSLYISAVSTLGYVNAYNMNADYQPVFEGYKIAVCPGMRDNGLVIAQSSNLFFGTDLLSDHTRIQLMDMANLDGSDNIRCVARYSAGVQSGIGADILRMQH